MSIEEWWSEEDSYYNINDKEKACILPLFLAGLLSSRVSVGVINAGSQQFLTHRGTPWVKGQQRRRSMFLSCL